MTEALQDMQSDLLKALSHPTRIQILQMLRAGELCVCEIFPALDIEQPNVSRHLSVLKKEGIVTSRKEGLKVIYRVTDRKVYELLDMTTEILRQQWAAKNRALA